jgi:hypothetical protein
LTISRQPSGQLRGAKQGGGVGRGRRLSADACLGYALHN